jgi:hypothetical protein
VGETKPGGLSISAERGGERREIPWRGETPPKIVEVPKSSPYLVSPARRKPGRKRMPRKKEDLHRDFITASFLAKRGKKFKACGILAYPRKLVKKTYFLNTSAYREQSGLCGFFMEPTRQKIGRDPDILNRRGNPA